MTVFSIPRRARIHSLAAATLFLSGLTLSGAHGQTMSCPILADMLAHQNTPLQDAAERLTPCARKHAKYDDSLKSRSKSEWQRLCEQSDTQTYLRLADNRETILMRCQPRGSTR